MVASRQKNIRERMTAVMEVRAVSKYVRISPAKVRMVVDAVKGKPVEAGLNTLKFMPQKAASLVEKTIRSAVANAEQNADLDIDQLVIRNIIADQGPTLKRFRARARGRGTRILKRTSHITVILAEEPSAL
jgi:large subunit ribosomal protein L22